MTEGHRLGEHVQQEGLRLLVILVQARLDELEVPVAQLGEDEFVERERGPRELELPDRVADQRRRMLQAGEDPAILDPDRLR